jgi:hypothetical protein
MKRIIFAIIVFFLFPIGVSFAQSVADDFHSEILTLYNFDPKEATKEDIAKIEIKLDEFWSKVEHNKETYLELLRNELSDYSNPSFFFFDGSRLLLKISNDIGDKQIVLKAFTHYDLKGIQRFSYFMTVHNLAVENLDTADVALHILDLPTFKVYIPQHSFTLNQGDSLIYMLLPTKESYYLDKAIERLRTEKNETAKKSLIDLLWATVTKSGDEAIAAFINDPSQPKDLKSYAGELSLPYKGPFSFYTIFSIFRSEKSLREKRRKVMHRVSDEAIYDFIAITQKIRQKFKSREGEKNKEISESLH